MGSIALGNRSPRHQASRVVRRMIENGTWPTGERIPGEEQLCLDLQVSRRTVRSVLEQLEAEGMLEGRGRKGRFVTWAGNPRLTLINRTIVVITHTRGRIDPLDVSGSLASVDAGVMYEIGDRGRSSLVIPDGLLAEFPTEEIISNRPLGIVLVEPAVHTPGIEQLLSDCEAADIPVVVDSHHESLAGFDRVICDHYRGGYDLTTHLIERGARRVLLIQDGLPGQDWPARKIAGYRDAMAAAGLEALPVVEPIELAARSESAGVLELRARQYAGSLVEHLSGPNRVDAIMATSDSDVFPISKACELFGVDPRRDLLLAGFDNYWQASHERRHCEFAGVVSVDKRNHLTGRELVRLLMDRLDGKLPAAPQCRLITPKVLPAGEAALATAQTAASSAKPKAPDALR